MTDFIQSNPVLVTGTSQGTATTIYTVPAYTKRLRLFGLTVAAKGTWTSAAYTYVGVVREDDATTTTWEPLFSPYVPGGQAAAWGGDFFLSVGDELVAWSTVSGKNTVTPAMEDITS